MQFGVCCLSPEYFYYDPLDAGCRVACDLSALLRDFFCGLKDPWSVHQHQHLRGDGCRLAVADGHSGVRKVELFEEREEMVSDHRQEDGASMAIVLGVVDRGMVEDKLAVAKGNAFTSDFQVEVSGRKKDCVADLFCI